MSGSHHAIECANTPASAASIAAARSTRCSRLSITTALKKERASDDSIAAVTAAMTMLNRSAAEALREVETEFSDKRSLHAVTDVTGFSLLGHAREMALGDPANNISAVSFEMEHTAFKYFPGAVEAAREGHLSEFAPQPHRRRGDPGRFAGVGGSNSGQQHRPVQR